MTSREDHQTDVSHHAAAIARWDDEGGASMSARSNTGERVSKDVRSKRMAEATADLKFDQAPAEDKKILECLGAAVIMRWGTLPTKIQRELFEHATSLADLAQTAPPKGQIARFLHNHKDDGARTTRTMPRRVVCDPESAAQRLIKGNDVSAERGSHGYERAACGHACDHGGLPLRCVLGRDGACAREGGSNQQRVGVSHLSVREVRPPSNVQRRR